MEKNVPAYPSAIGEETLSKGGTLRLSWQTRARFINRVAIRLSHEKPIPLKDVIEELEKKVIIQVLNDVDGNQKDAARILGTKYTTLYAKLKRYGIRVKRISTVLFGAFFLCSSLAFSVPAADDLAKKAIESLDIMSYQRAVSLLTQVVAENPDREEARVDLPYAHYRSGNAEEALGALEQERALFPGSFNALILEAYVRFREGDVEGAVGVCRDFDSELFLFVRDKVKVEAGKRRTFPPPPLMERKRFFEKYRSCLKEIQSGLPNFGLPSFILGNHEQSRGNPDRAKKEFLFALETGYDPDAWYAQLIDVKLTKQDWRQALCRADEAEEIQGPRVEFHFLRGYSHFQLGETENAVACFERALELEPYLVEAMKNLAKIRLSQGESRKAVPLEGFEFQISRGLLPSNNWQLFFHLKRPELKFPVEGDPDDVARWLALDLPEIR